MLDFIACSGCWIKSLFVLHYVINLHLPNLRCGLAGTENVPKLKLYIIIEWWGIKNLLEEKGTSLCMWPSQYRTDGMKSKEFRCASLALTQQHSGAGWRQRTFFRVFLWKLAVFWPGLAKRNKCKIVQGD